MIDFKVKPDNGTPYAVTADSRDVAAWERGGKARSIGQLGENPRMVDLYALAHLASRRTQQFAGDLGEFESSCVLEFEFAEEDGAADPTDPAR